MKNISLFSIGGSLGKTKDIPRLIKGLNFYERIVFWAFFWVAMGALAILLSMGSNKFLVTVPIHGGSFNEGIVGRPGFINPVLALSETDKDLAQLVYSGIMRRTPNGELVEDLAESVAVSDDGLSYTVTLREGLTWHDGEPLTAEDVVFTIQKIKDPLLKSPLQASWDGVSIQQLDERTVTFQLNEPYALFPDNLTIGILPKHIWQNFVIEDFNNNVYNTEPIGSGPYAIDSIKRDRAGLVEEYTLHSFSDFALGEPFINKISIKFFNDEESAFQAYKSGRIDSLGGITPVTTSEIDNKERVYTFPLTRIFAVFLNQNEAQVFTEEEVRKALFYGIDRKKIINEILFGYGAPITGPFPEGASGFEAKTSTKTKSDAKKILTENGWTLNENGIYENDGVPLQFTLATANIGELKQVAELLQQEWREIGVEVELNFFEIGDLNQEIIRPREYDALLFGEVTGVDPDPFAFWHSSQRLDPGLNIALYANITADKLLEDARSTRDRNERIEKYTEFSEEVQADFPAVFLYSPYYIYLTPNQVKNVNPFPLTTGSDRFINIHEWHIKTDKIWNFFL